MKFLHVLVLGVCLAITSIASAAQPTPIAESFASHRSVLSCPGADNAHAYEQCAFEFMRRVACDHQADVALWPKSGGTFCTHNGRGYDCDKLVVLASGEMFDVVVAAGSPNQAPSWNRVGTGVFSGTVPAPSCSVPPPPFGVPIGEAAVTIFDAFEVAHERGPSDVEVVLIAAEARRLGWDGGPRITPAVVDALVTFVGRYSGDPANPFPTISPAEALRQLNERWQARFARDVHEIELQAIVAYALTQWDGQGNVPVWLIEDILRLTASYHGELVAGLPAPIDPLTEIAFVDGHFTLDDEPRYWDGVTAFMLQYEWFDSRPRYESFVAAMVLAKVKTLRVGISVETAYLTLTPQSGGTFGSGRTRPLYPGDGWFSWEAYRVMLRDLNRRGFIVEVVPFLTDGAYNPDGRNPGGRENHDTTVPQSMTEASRMAFIEEVARELLPIRALTIEIANEYLFIGFASDGHEITRLAMRYKQLDPARQVTTSAYHPSWGDYRTIHVDRHTSPRSWSWVLEQLKFPRPGLFTANDEGINADTVGEFGNDASPANHWANGVLSRLIPNWGYTFHYDRALKGLPPSAGDGSLQAINAWRDGINAVPSTVAGQYLAYPHVLGADAAVARLGDTAGLLLLIGATTPPQIPEWAATLISAAGPHRLYSLTR